MLGEKDKGRKRSEERLKFRNMWMTICKEVECEEWNKNAWQKLNKKPYISNYKAAR